MRNYILKLCLINLIFVAFGSLAGEKLTNRVDAEIDEKGKLTINSGYLTSYIFRGVDPSSGDKGSMKIVRPAKSAVDFDFVDVEWDGLLPKGFTFKKIAREKEPTEIYLNNYAYPNSINWVNSDFTLTGASLVGLIQNLPSDRQKAIDTVTLFLLNLTVLADIGLEALEKTGKVGAVNTEQFDKVKDFAELIMDSKALLDRAELLIAYTEVVHETAVLFINAANLKEEDNLFLYEYLSYIEVTLTAADKLKDLIGYQGQVSKESKGIIRGTIKNQFKEFLNDFDLDKPSEEALDFVAKRFAEDFKVANGEDEKLEQILRYIIEPLNTSLKAYVNLMELERKVALQAGDKIKAERYKSQIATMRNGRAILTFASLLFATPDVIQKIYKEPELIVPLLFDLGVEVTGQLKQSLTTDDVEVVAKATWQKISRLDGRHSSFHKIRGGVKKIGAFMQGVSAGMVIGNKIIPFVWDAVLAPNQINGSIVSGEFNSYGSMVTQAKIYKLDKSNNKEHISTLSNIDLHNTNISLEDGDRLQIDVSLSRPKMFDETRSPWLMNLSQVPKELFSLDISSAGSYSQNFLCVRKLYGDLTYAAYHFEELVFNPIAGKCGSGTFFGSDWFDGSRVGSSIYHSHKSLNERYKLQTLLTDINPIVSYEYTYQDGDHPISILIQGDSSNLITHNVTITPKPINIGFSFDEVRLNDGSLNVLFDVSQIISSEHDPVSHFIWNFGDGSGDMISYDQAKAHNYNEGGTYTITLTVVTESGQQYQVKDVVILGVKPDAPYFVKIDSTINDDDDVSLELFWQEIEGINEFNIYIANESFADLDDIENYASLSGARRFSAISTPPYQVDDLALNTEYFVVITSQNNVNESLPSNELKVEVNKTEPTTATGKLNDTGITWCAGGGSNNLDCPATGFEGQDAEYGRDAQAKAGTLEKVGGGNAGFDFTKLDANGNDLPESATAWSCVRDNHTGLIWEVKTDDGGLHDINDLYNWYNPDSNTNGGHPGYQDDDGDICYGYDANNQASYCNTQAYVERVNTQSLCGASDWRMPTRLELMGSVDNGTTSPTIDTQYFPQTQSSWFWSSSPYAIRSNSAWGVYFGNGYVNSVRKSASVRVRLVRGRP